MDDSKTLKGIENKLSALLALTALSVSDKGRGVKLEVLLKGAGLEVAEIAKVLGKNEQAVRKMIMRTK
jgi:DNA-directed RNA polymerase specialized sigma24 family protein